MEEIAQVYARSLFEAAKDQDKLDEIREQLGTFADAVAESHDLQVFLFSPYLSTEEKKQGLRRAIEGADEAFLNFLDLMVENHRMPVIFRVRREFDELWEEENQLLPVQVTSAVPLDARRASDREVNAAFKDRPEVKSRMETEWDTTAKAGYARARELAESAAVKIR